MLNVSGSHLPSMYGPPERALLPRATPYVSHTRLLAPAEKPAAPLTSLPLPNAIELVLRAKFVSPNASAYSPLAVELLPPAHEKKPTVASSHSLSA